MCKGRLLQWSLIALLATIFLSVQIIKRNAYISGHAIGSRMSSRLPKPRPKHTSTGMLSKRYSVGEKLGQPVTKFSPPRCGTGVYENYTLLNEYVQKSRYSAFSESNLELYMRFNGLRLGETRSSFLPSLQLFWPSAHVLIVMDKETDASLAGQLPSDVAKEFPPLSIRTALLADYKEIKKAWPRWHGGDRMRLDMLYADHIVKAKYVGFVDSDTFFVAPVEPQGIFTDDGRPIVQASVARTNLGSDPNTDLWWKSILVAEFFLKKPQAMNCMSYFPVVFATKHIREMREYVERVHGRPFRETIVALYNTLGVRFGYFFWCHYSVMCNYVWYFKRSEYAFYFSNVHNYRPGWDKPMRGQVTDFSFLKKHRTAPFVRMSFHFSYVYFGELAKESDGFGVQLPRVGHLGSKFNGTAAEVPILRCFCHMALVHCQIGAIPECQRVIEKCLAKGVTRDKLNFFLFRFESATLMANMPYMQTREFDPNAIDTQKWYYNSLHTPREWLVYAKSIIKAKHCTVAKQLL